MTINLPLTFNCGGANLLRDNNLREFAYPFDWTIKNRGTILNLIKNKGNGFLLDGNVVVGKESYKHKYENDPNNWVVLKNLFDKGTGSLLVHDYPAEGIELSKIRDKYIKRFDRLESQLNQANKVIIYTDTHKKIKDIPGYEGYVESLGFDFSKYLPEDESIETIRDYISSYYNIKNIEIIKSI